MQVKKRSGKLVDYNGNNIILAITCAFMDAETKNNKYDLESINNIADSIENSVYSSLDESKDVWSVEDIQDEIEVELMRKRYLLEAKAFILYRNMKRRERKSTTEYKYLSSEFLSKYKHKPSPFPNQLGEFVYYRTYSRYIAEKNRREYWWETVARAVDYNMGLVPQRQLSNSILEAETLYDNIFNLKQFLSGRTMFTGGSEVSKKYGMSNFNCSFTIIDNFKSYKDMFYLLMLGAGVGYRVLKEDVAKLPKIRTDINVVHQIYNVKEPHKRQEYSSIVFTKNVVEIFIGDSKEAWADALYRFLELHFSKQYSKVDSIILNYDNIRPKGERLKTFGGYSSGYQSMQTMLLKIDNVLKSKKELQFKKLSTLECSDIANIIGENVVSGGVRRSSEVCLFDIDDDEIRYCKSELFKQDEEGVWAIDKSISHRRMSNNSIQYWTKPEREFWHEHIKAMRYSGEPALQNMVAAKLRRKDVQGSNPCMEILLRDKGVCNLTEVNVSGFVENGKLDEVGLLQAQMLSARAGYRMASIEFELEDWDLINKEDMLVGCSLTGWQDMVNATLMSKDEEGTLLRKLKKVAIESSEEMAIILGTNKPKLHTTIKPSGTLSQLPTVSNGIHWSHSPYYIRRVRISEQDPLAQVAIELDWTWSPEVGQTIESMDTMVIDFYVKSPEGRTKYNVNAIEQLEEYKLFMENYANHNVSITVHVKDDEWEDVEEWCYNNWEILVAVSFLPLDDSFYQLLPYEAITKDEYDEFISTQLKFKPDLLLKYETSEDSELDESECADGSCPTR